jgi:hypothetical protein
MKALSKSTTKSLEKTGLEANQVPKTSFNPAQLATYVEARQIAMLLTAAGIGGGVRPGDDEHGEVEVLNPNMPWLPSVRQIPGIYVPYWLAGPGGFEEPFSNDGVTKKFWLHFRFRNGMEGVNVGLVRELFLSYPKSPAYVLNTLSHEVGF